MIDVLGRLVCSRVSAFGYDVHAAASAVSVMDGYCAHRARRVQDKDVC